MTAAALIQQAAATVTALVTLGGAVWWLAGPRVKAYVRETAAAAQIVEERQRVGLQEATAEVARASASTLDQVGSDLHDLRVELAAITAELADHVRQADHEVQLYRAVLFAAGIPPLDTPVVPARPSVVTLADALAERLAERANQPNRRTP